MNDRRQYALFIVTQLIFAGLLFLSGSTIWIEKPPDPGLGDLTVGVAETGAQIIPLIPVVAVVALIAVLGVIATGEWGRRIIGVATACVAIANVFATMNTGIEGIGGWIFLVVALSGGIILTSLGAVVAGRRWPQLGKKYQRDQPGDLPRDPWKALDQGIDPTVEPGDLP